MADFQRESMLDLFIYEMNQLLEQLEQSIIQGEQGYSSGDINEIFRIMHTIKGSAAMMLYHSVEETSHAIEDLFFYLREENPSNVDYSTLTDLVLEGMDFIKGDLVKIEAGAVLDADPSEIIARIKGFLSELKGEKSKDTSSKISKAPEKKETKTGASESSAEQETDDELENGAVKYKAKVVFEAECEMKNVRAFTIIQNMKEMITNVNTEPEDILAESADKVIAQNGFVFTFYSTEEYSRLLEFLNSTTSIESVELQTQKLNHFKARIFFEDGCEMENVRSFTVVHNLKNFATNITHIPEDVIDESAVDIIRKDGFNFKFSIGKPYEDVYDMLSQTVFLKELTLYELGDLEDGIVINDNEKVNIDLGEPSAEIKKEVYEKAPEIKESKKEDAKAAMVNANASVNEAASTQKKQTPTQQMISVNIGKLDQLLNLMGELVISEAMTTQNPDLEGLELESFNKSARQLRKIINDVQDTVMSLRMVSLSTTFFKMHRIVRDMCKQLGKNVDLVIVGEETEVDKNIIEHISDPIMHMIRNSVDHGIETIEERIRKKKDEKGTVILEAKNAGGEVLIIVKDDGAGINTDKVLKKAMSVGLLKKPAEEYTEREICQFIFHPGLSTNDAVTTFSGRGVGMDVVLSNIEMVGGSIVVDSVPNQGTTTILKIPLTLAIIEGMLINMGGAKYTIPIASILETFKAKKENIFTDPDGNEMITLRGEIYNIVRLHEFFKAPCKEIKDIEEGVLIMIENEGQSICLFVDELVGEQQVVVKTMPKYINKIKGISGCTLLGNGDISLIIDVAGFFDK